jgi:nucleoside-diphosphate-sugar epimerase
MRPLGSSEVYGPGAWFMNILVTGATGYLGSRLLTKLLQDPNHQLILLVRRQSRLSRIQHLLPRVRTLPLETCDFPQAVAANAIDAVVHCATNYGRKEMPRPDIVEANLLLPLRILDGVLRSGRKVVFVNTDTMLDRNVSTYSLSKKQFCDWLSAYSDEIACVNVVLEHFFGPGDDPTKFVSYVVQELLRGAPRIALTGRNPSHRRSRATGAAEVRSPGIFELPALATVWSGLLASQHSVIGDWRLPPVDARNPRLGSRQCGADGSLRDLQGN